MEKVTLTFSHLLSHLGEASLRAHYVLQQLASVFHTSQISSTSCFSQGQKCQKPREEDTMNEWVAAGVALILTFTAQWTKLPDYLCGLKRRGKNVPEANHWTNAIVNSWGTKKRQKCFCGNVDGGFLRLGSCAKAMTHRFCLRSNPLFGWTALWTRRWQRGFNPKVNVE